MGMKGDPLSKKTLLCWDLLKKHIPSIAARKAKVSMSEFNDRIKDAAWYYVCEIPGYTREMQMMNAINAYKGMTRLNRRRELCQRK
jgi:hypothetical protein